MYEEFFHLSTHPFRNSPDPAFFYRSVSHREALTMLAYGVREGKGFMLVTGDVGTGKTMLAHALKAELGERAMMVEVPYPWVSAEDILATIRARIGLAPASPENPAAVEELRARLIELAQDGRQVVVVIDEAHQVPVKTLEGIRLISNIESSTQKLLQIVLLGQEELGTLLSQYSLRQVQQRIAMSCHLRPLDRNETWEYIRHRLLVAGGNPELFSAGAAARIHEYSGGCPRLINQACDFCLLFAYGKFAPQVDETLARSALAALDESRTGSALRASPAEPLAAPRANEEGARRNLASLPAAQSVPAIEPVVPQRAETPMRIPGAGARKAGSGEIEPAPQGGKALLFVAIAILVVGVLMMGGGIWIYLMRGSEASAPKPAPARAVASLPPIESRLQLGLVVPAFSGQPAKEVRISADLSMPLLASQHFGTWNATVRDLIAAANPQLGGFESSMLGALVRFPQLSRPAMIVVDAGGRYYVYYASFEQEDQARNENEAIQQGQRKATLLLADRKGQAVYRLFVGPFDARGEAEAAAGSIWFKYLPSLNQQG